MELFSVHQIIASIVLVSYRMNGIIIAYANNNKIQKKQIILHTALLYYPVI